MQSASVAIPLDNSTNHNGICLFDNSTSYLSVEMDMGNIKFFFFFNKTSKGKKYDSYMYDVHVTYNPNSTYFPNHEWTGKKTWGVQTRA